MNPQPLFCPNAACPSRGCEHAGNLVIHASLKQRYKGKTCNKTFSARRGTVLYRVQTQEQTVWLVLALLAYGCPIQAIVFAFGLDERTVRRWLHKAGAHCHKLHQHLVVDQPRVLAQVQADELRVRLQKRLVVWMALALQVPTRLWLGGAIQPTRDQRLLAGLATTVKAQALFGPLLLVTDGLASYIKSGETLVVSPISDEALYYKYPGGVDITCAPGSKPFARPSSPESAVARLCEPGLKS